jgi:UDP-glucuronate 4-epimerase
LQPAPVLVTGAAGLVGARVVELLSTRGIQVVPTDLFAAADGMAAADLSDPGAVERLFEASIGSIIHCGAISGPMLGRNDPAGTIAVNVSGTVHLLEQARRRRLGRFVHCSSIAAYGATAGQPVPVSVSAPLAAPDVYGASKAAADGLVRAYAHDHGVDACCLRIGWVYGPRRRTRSLLHRVIRDALDGRPTIIEHDGSHAIQQIHVDDVARGLIAAWDARDVAGRAFNLTAGVRHRMKDLAAIVAGLLPAARVSFTEGAVYQDVVQDLFDIADTEARLGWKPAVPIEVGIADYIEWLREHEY